MRKISMLAAVLITLITVSFTASKKQPRLLIFYKTAGYYHKSIPAGIAAIQKLGKENGLDVAITKDSLDFNTKNLKNYRAVVFLNTTGNVLDAAGQEAFEKFIRSGKGYMGIHAAADTEYEWPWYNQLVGAYFKSHPDQQNAKLLIQNQSFGATSHLPKEWTRWDEWYNYKDTHWDKATALITIDEKSYKGGANGDYHPIAWYHDFDGGRSFYTGLGHTDESYTDPMFLKHLLGGIQYVLGR